MSTQTADPKEAPWLRRLYLPTYRVSEAARYVGAHPNTVGAWHYRESPVLPGHSQGKALTYLELVEVAFVKFFRNAGVSMKRIRDARQYIANFFGVEFPLAVREFKTEGMHVLMSYDQFDHDPHLEQVVVADQSGQLAWSALMGEVFAGFEYEYNLALRWHPAGWESLVVIDPRVSFGAPVVEGLPTWVVKGRRKAGEPISEIADDFGISERAVRDALRFESMEEAA